MTVGASKAETPSDKHWHRGKIVNQGKWGGGRAPAKSVGGKAGDIEVAARQEVEEGTERELGGERHIGGWMGWCHSGPKSDALFIPLA